MRILEKIHSHAKLKKDIVAVINPSIEGSDSQLTYGELNDLSDRLATYLQNTLQDNTSPIVVYGHKHPYMLVCFLAIVKSGRAYCPVDTSIPLHRVKDIIESTSSPIIFATENLDLQNIPIVSLSEIKKIIQSTQNKINPSHYVKKDDIYYIIFTSGSTGKPKGVQITEDCLYNFIKWAITLGNKDFTTTQNTFINQAPFSFDLSVMDLYMSLYTGGTLWCLEKSVQTDAKKLFYSLSTSHANVWVSTPSFATLCLADESFQQKMMPKMQLFLFCGETLTNRTAKLLLERFPKATIVNTYGPTESTVAITEIIVTPQIAATQSPLPVGRAKPGTYLYAINQDGAILPEGEKGEILIVGDTVSTGYFQNPDLTQRAFSTHRANGQILRSYKTGDEGYIKEGQLYYCGRIDLQIKLHGYRIEIEDIENNLLKLPYIKNAVVIPKITDGAVESLVAFAVVNFTIESTLKASQQIKKDLKRFLPNYMIPKKIVFVDQIPMTNNGKLDRKKMAEGIL